MHKKSKKSSQSRSLMLVLLILLVALALLLSNCGKNNDDPAPTPTQSPEQTQAPTQSPEQTTAPTQSPEQTQAPTQSPAPTQEVSGETLPETGDAGKSYIDKLIFIGDSTTYGLKAYNVVNASQVWTPSSGTLALFNQSIATVVYPATGEEILIVDAVTRAKPEYIVLTIGVNGVSMMEEDAFKSDYIDLITRIKAASPGTKIICNSIYPVESMYEAKNNGINNAKIDRANGWISAIAQQTGCAFTDSASVLKGSDGCLRPEYGNGDGIHLCTAGFNAVLDYLRTHEYK